MLHLTHRPDILIRTANGSEIDDKANAIESNTLNNKQIEQKPPFNLHPVPQRISHFPGKPQGPSLFPLGSFSLGVISGDCCCCCCCVVLAAVIPLVDVPDDGL